MRSLLPALILTVSLGMAAAIGYAAHSLCTVRAVSEIMDRRSADMLFSFGKAALWAALIVVPLRWAEIGAIAEAVVPRLGIAILAGAFVFGVGVALNNA